MLEVSSEQLLERLPHRFALVQVHTQETLRFRQPEQAGCERCVTLSRKYGYGIGIVRNGSWLLQNPLFGGYAAIESYLPSKRISIAMAVTFKPSSFDAEGNYSSYWSSNLYVRIASILAPHDRPVTR